MNVIDIGACVTPMTYFAREYLKIKPSVKLGIHKIYSGYVDSDEKSSLPITIIKNENTSNTLSNFVYSSCNSKCKALNAGKNVSVCSSEMWGCLNDEKII